jgi:hypothetical protein
VEGHEVTWSRSEWRAFGVAGEGDRFEEVAEGAGVGVRVVAGGDAEQLE